MDRPVRRFGKHKRDYRAARRSERGERGRSRDERARSKQALRIYEANRYSRTG